MKDSRLTYRYKVGSVKTQIDSWKKINEKIKLGGIVQPKLRGRFPDNANHKIGLPLIIK